MVWSDLYNRVCGSSKEKWSNYLVFLLKGRVTWIKWSIYWIHVVCSVQERNQFVIWCLTAAQLNFCGQNWIIFFGWNVGYNFESIACLCPESYKNIWITECDLCSNSSGLVENAKRITFFIFQGKRWPGVRSAGSWSSIQVSGRRSICATWLSNWRLMLNAPGLWCEHTRHLDKSFYPLFQLFFLKK